MSGISDYLEDALVGHLFRTTDYTSPSVMAIALLTAIADDDDTGTFSTSTGTEVANAGAYARQNRPPLDANWAETSSGNGQTSNLAAITFPTATADWGTIVGIGLCDSASHDSGNLLVHGPLDTAKDIDNGDTAEFAVGAIVVTFN